MIWNSEWRSRFVSKNYWRKGWRGEFSNFLYRLGNAIAAFNDIQGVFEKTHKLEAEVERLHNELLESTSISVQLGIRLEKRIAEVEQLKKLLIVTRT